MSDQTYQPGHQSTEQEFELTYPELPWGLHHVAEFNHRNPFQHVPEPQVLGIRQRVDSFRNKEGENDDVIFVDERPVKRVRTEVSCQPDAESASEYQLTLVKELQAEEEAHKAWEEEPQAQEEEPEAEKEETPYWKKRYDGDKVALPEHPFALESYSTSDTGRYRCFHESASCGNGDCNHRCCKEGYEKHEMVRAINKKKATYKAQVERLIKKGDLDPKHKVWAEPRRGRPKKGKEQAPKAPSYSAAEPATVAPIPAQEPTPTASESDSPAAVRDQSEGDSALEISEQMGQVATPEQEAASHDNELEEAILAGLMEDDEAVSEPDEISDAQLDALFDGPEEVELQPEPAPDMYGLGPLLYDPYPFFQPEPKLDMYGLGPLLYDPYPFL
jgi:hypothetical protein